MFTRLYPLLFLTLCLCIPLSAGQAQESFSCPFGTDGACLSFGDKVCPGSGKCVDQNASCFDSFACDYNGFACKSDVDEIRTKYNDLVTRYNSSLDEIDQLTGQVVTLRSTLTDMQTCLSAARSLEQAQACSF